MVFCLRPFRAYITNSSSTKGFTLGYSLAPFQGFYTIWCFCLRPFRAYITNSSSTKGFTLAIVWRPFRAFILFVLVCNTQRGIINIRQYWMTKFVLNSSAYSGIFTIRAEAYHPDCRTEFKYAFLFNVLMGFSRYCCQKNKFDFVH